MTPPYLNDCFNLISTLHTHSACQSLNQSLLLNPVQTNQPGIWSLQHTGTVLEASGIRCQLIS